MQHGYDNTKVEEICKLADTAKGSFFYYFKTKETVVELLLDQQMGQLSKQMALYLSQIPSPTDQMSLFMQQLLFHRQVGPESMHYFKEAIPLWFDTLSHKKRDMLILPIIQNIVNKGRELGEFSAQCNNTVTEIIYLGISQIVHQHFEDLNDSRYLRESITNFEYVLNTILATKNTKINISVETHENPTAHRSPNEKS